MTTPILLLDVDGTLTAPRRELGREMATALANLNVPFVVAAGSDRRLIEHQFLEPLWESGFRKDFDAFLANGGLHCRCNFSRDYSIDELEQFDFGKHLGTENYSYLIGVLKGVLSGDRFRLPESQSIVGEQIINRGPMVNFAPPGRERGPVTSAGRQARAEFVEFDKSSSYRLLVKAYLTDRLRHLIEGFGLQVLIGGETSFDLVIKGKDKTNAITTMLEQGAQRIIFFGDALFDGGNDEPVRHYIEDWAGPGVCPVEMVPVDGWEDALEQFRRRGWLDSESDL